MDNVSSVFLLVCLLVSLLGNITQLQQQSIGSGGENNTINISSRYTKPNNQQRRRPKLGDGCRHVFLDVGSNIGVHGRILFEPHLYPIRNSTNAFTQTENVVTFSARTFFKEQLGPEDERVNTDICIFSFEPNPRHVQRQKELEEVYNKLGWRYHFIHAGVSDVDSEITFYHIGKGVKVLERGFTMIKERCHRTCIPEKVKVFRLSDWINNEIHDRIIPDDIMEYRDSVLAPRVVMKLDIEMAEWVVLPDLITSGVLCQNVIALLAEFHLYEHRRDYPIHFLQNNWTLHTYKEAEVLKEEMIGMINRNKLCSAKIIEGDDESYELDGMPFPEQP